MTKVCLIDGSGYIFRAFYALPPMTAPNGTPVNAVYGFVTMFMRLLKNIPCDYCVVLFDAKRKNFRNEYFADYKANREEPPELLIPQFDLIHKAVEAMGLPYVMQEGYEADDLIATYTQQSLAKGFEVVVVTGDKDLMQLIRPHVTYYDGMKDKYYTEEDVKEKFGVYPDKVVYVQALSGDKIDNIPGVAGIGPKGAADLINEFGTLQNVLDNIDNIKQNRCRNALLQNKSNAELSLKLVTLKNDVPVEHDLSEFKCHAPNEKILMDFVDSLGFRSIRPKLEKWADERNDALGNSEIITTKQNIPAPDIYEKIIDDQQLQKLADKIKSQTLFAFQVLHNTQETVGISICCEPHMAYYIPLPQLNNNNDLFSFDTKNQSTVSIAALRQFLHLILTDKDILKIAADIKTQWHYLNEICEQELDLWPYDDIAIMSYDLDSTEHEHTIGVLSDIYLNLQLPEPKSIRKAVIDFEAEEYGNFIYAVSDAVLRIYPLIKNRINQEHKNYVYEKLDRRLAQVLMKMEHNGITIDVTSLKNLDIEFSAQLEKIEKSIFQLTGEEFNLNSPAQVGQILYEKLGLKGKRSSTGKYNTSAEVLETFAEENEIAAKILEWRTFSKLKSTYTTALLEAKDNNNRVHTTFSQLVVNTGRLASSSPNLQNIPNRTEIGRKIRGCFIAQKGYKLVAADYSQMELRLMAAIADVKALQEEFANNIDIHAATAARVFNLPYEQVDREHRSRAKAINFGIIYGISQYGLAKQIDVSPAEAKKYIDAYFAIMPEVKLFMEQQIAKAHQNGYVETPFGRKCLISGINAMNQHIAAFAERAAINAPIQGGAADIVKLAMIEIDHELQKRNLDARMLLQVHDELVIEASEDIAFDVAELMKKIMERVADDTVKLVADVGIGDNWNMAH